MACVVEVEDGRGERSQADALAIELWEEDMEGKQISSTREQGVEGTDSGRGLSEGCVVNGEARVDSNRGAEGGASEGGVEPVTHEAGAPLSWSPCGRLPILPIKFVPFINMMPPVPGHVKALAHDLRGTFHTQTLGEATVDLLLGEQAGWKEEEQQGAPQGITAGVPTSGAAYPGASFMASLSRAALVLIPGLLGGSADLASSNKTLLKEFQDYGKASHHGRNIRYGIREHAMGAISNGLALHGTGLIPFASTFLVFSDYMRPTIRLAALSGAGVLFVFTHDSIGLGEDGPTHQPVEHLPSLRAIPNLVVLRPGDAFETSGAYRIAMQRRQAPTAIVLSRQKVSASLEGSSADEVSRGAYVLRDWVGSEPEPKPDIILLASGAEVSLCQEAVRKLRGQGISVRVVSFVSWELFREQSQHYRDTVLPPDVPLRLAVEAGSPMGWCEWVGPRGHTLGVNTFGASGRCLHVFKAFGLTVENVVAQSLKLFERNPN